MSIATEITRLQGVKQNIRSALVDKGVTAAANHDMADFPQDIADIPAGSDTLLDFLKNRITTLDYSSETFTTFKQYAFAYSSSLETLILPTTMTEIPPHMCEGCYHLRSFTIPSAVTSIGAYAFNVGKGNTDLTEIVIPPSVQTIADHAFYNSNFTVCDIPATVLTLAGLAYAENTELVTAKVRAQTIGTANTMGTFRNCTGLRRVWLSDDVTTILASSATYAPFASCSASLEIYCEAAAKPDGWGTNWNKRTSSATFTVHWGTTEEQFDALT